MVGGWNYQASFPLKTNASHLPKATFLSPLSINSLGLPNQTTPSITINPMQKFFATHWVAHNIGSCRFLESLVSNRNIQCDSDFRPFNMRRRITSMPPCELSLLIQPWVLLRFRFLGWYSVPLFLVRTCWYCQEGCWNTAEPSACEDSIHGDLEIPSLSAALGTIQLLNDLRWVVPLTGSFPVAML